MNNLPQLPDVRSVEGDLARLNTEARERRWANMRPMDAATLILVDQTGPELRVLMGKRHPNHKFMPGVFVFPGGRAEREDALVPALGALNPSCEASLLIKMAGRASRNRARRLALAAIRETFEETGLVIGTALTGQVPGLSQSAAARKAGAPNMPAKLAPDSPWRDMLARGFAPNLSALRFLARAITPPKRPKRFDTRFFVADAQAIVQDSGFTPDAHSELTELRWLTLPQTEEAPLPAITRVMLGELRADYEARQRGETRKGVPFYFERHGAFQREMIA